MKVHARRAPARLGTKSVSSPGVCLSSPGTVADPSPAPAGPATPGQASPGSATGPGDVSCSDEVRQRLPQALTVSFWSATGLPVQAGEPLLRIRGRRVDDGGRGQRFVRDESLIDVPAGEPFAVTARIFDAGAGQWETTAAVVSAAATGNRRARRRQPAGLALEPATWSWRGWALRSAEAAAVDSGAAPLARIPGVARGAWAAAVSVAGVVALLAQQLLLADAGLDRWWGLVSTLAVGIGAGGARLWYRVLHRDRPGSGGGWAVQGFVTAAVVVLVLALVIGGASVGAVLDATAPGLLLGLGIGRVGCFFSGCCSGRTTASRWGVLASDRRLLTRRLPAQLYEAAVSVGLGATALAVIVAVPALAGSGALFAVAVALHVVLRQLLLPLRAEARRTAYGRIVVLVVALGVTAAATVIAALTVG